MFEVGEVVKISDEIRSKYNSDHPNFILSCGIVIKSLLNNSYVIRSTEIYVMFGNIVTLNHDYLMLREGELEHV